MIKYVSFLPTIAPILPLIKPILSKCNSPPLQQIINTIQQKTMRVQKKVTLPKV